MGHSLRCDANCSFLSDYPIGLDLEGTTTEIKFARSAREDAVGEAIINLAATALSGEHAGAAEHLKVVGCVHDHYAEFIRDLGNVFTAFLQEANDSEPLRVGD